MLSLSSFRDLRKSVLLIPHSCRGDFIFVKTCQGCGTWRFALNGSAPSGFSLESLQTAQRTSTQDTSRLSILLEQWIPKKDMFRPNWVLSHLVSVSLKTAPLPPPPATHVWVGVNLGDPSPHKGRFPFGSIETQKSPSVRKTHTHTHAHLSCFERVHSSSQAIGRQCSARSLRAWTLGST